MAIPSTERTGARRSGRWLRAVGLVLALLAASLVTLPTAATAAAGDVGSAGPSHAGTGTPTGTKRAESVLWFNDGSWWGNLWDTRTSDFHIFRFDAASPQWVDTGVTTETRANTHHDVLWDGTTLYVASHLFVNDGVPAAPNFPSTLRRYSYNTSTKTYTQLGSSQINNFKTETLSIDKDSSGQLWASWQQGNRIYLNNTNTDGATWNTPFPLPGGDVSHDDTSALIAFGPGKMGVMWSSQGPSGPAPTDGFYWSVHNDGAARTSWSAPTPVATGDRTGDDHMNLKWLDSAGGRVFAAVKTSFTSASQPLIELLAMDGAGSWTQTEIAKVSECPNRVIVLIDEAAQRLRTFASYPKPSGTTNAGVCTSSGGAIYEKSSPLGNISFTTDKTLRIADADQYVHNVSSTKQNLNHAASDGTSTMNSGLMIVADVNATSTYWYHFESGSAPPVDTTPPDTTITSGPSGTTSSTTASFEFSSSEGGSTFECQLDQGAFAGCTSPKSYSGLAPGSHTFSVRATDAAGNVDPTPATSTWTITTSTGGGIVRGSVSSAVNTTAATTLRIARPSGVVAGDVLVSCVSLNGGSIGAAGVPAGWTQMAAQTSQANPKVYGFFKVATSAEPADYAWTTSSVKSGGAIASYSGAAGLDTPAVGASGAAATSGTVGSVTTTVANAMLVGCMSGNSSAITFTPPGGMTEVVATGERRFELADGLQPTAGPSGNKTWTFSAAREWAGWLVALRPS